METRINIAKILKNKPRGTKLYSIIHGKCSFEAVTDEIFKINFCTSKFGLTQSGECTLIKFGNMYDGGECIIFPSKEMRDWSKFSWKKGDVLVGVGQRIIFEKFIDENYTEFQGKYSLSTYEDRTLVVDKRCYTSYFRKLDDSVNVKNYFKEIEERLGGELNRETLEIKKTHPKFKDGDILSCDEDSYTRHTTLILHKDENITESIVSLVRHRKLVKTNVPIDNFLLSRLYPAREDEKKELFDALAERGKAWDAEKKQIVDLKLKWTPKPFDKVVVRCGEADKWSIDFFSYKVSNGYICTGDAWFGYCLPYNEETAKLVGTKNNVED